MSSFSFDLWSPSLFLSCSFFSIFSLSLSLSLSLFSSHESAPPVVSFSFSTLHGHASSSSSSNRKKQNKRRTLPLLVGSRHLRSFRNDGPKLDTHVTGGVWPFSASRRRKPFWAAECVSISKLLSRLGPFVVVVVVVTALFWCGSI